MKKKKKLHLMLLQPKQMEAKSKFQSSRPEHFQVKKIISKEIKVKKMAFNSLLSCVSQKSRFKLK